MHQSSHANETLFFHLVKSRKSTTTMLRTHTTIFKRMISTSKRLCFDMIASWQSQIVVKSKDNMIKKFVEKWIQIDILIWLKIWISRQFKYIWLSLLKCANLLETTLHVESNRHSIFAILTFVIAIYERDILVLKTTRIRIWLHVRRDDDLIILAWC